jgi:hypothetical protein
MKRASIAIGLALLAAGGARAETAGFGDWAAVCDNVRACAAFGFSPEGEEGIGWLKLARGGAPAAPPVVSLSAHGSGTTVWTLTIDGRPVAGVGALTARSEADSVYQSVTLAPAEAAALVQAIRNGSSLRLGRDLSISLTGSAAALRWLDDRQKRAGTASALVAKGPLPASPAPPAPPLVKAAPPVAQTKLPSRPSAALRQTLKDCEDDIPEGDFPPEVHRLSPGVLLWAVVCSRGAYNLVYELYLTDEAGGQVRPAMLEHAQGAGPTNSLMNIGFDPKTQTLSNFDKARGLGDCGAEGEWLWDGRAFQRKWSTVMPECRGVLLDDWPTDFVSRQR